MKILIGGDLVPTDSNFALFNSSKVEELIGTELKKLLDESKYKVFNLEVPITDVKSPIKKNGPNLSAPISTMSGIKALNPSLLILANNHIMDQDSQGLFTTLELLKKYKIAYIGAGKNLRKADNFHILENDTEKVCIYAIAEHEFSIATKNTPGANPFDPLYTFDRIAELKETCDFLIVLYHGGKEHYQYPSPNSQKIAQKITAKGADLVVFQHSHTIGCFEKHNNSTIIYGQGNFLFDYSDNIHWKNSLLLEIDTSKKMINYIPIQKQKNLVRLSNEKTAKKILREFFNRSDCIVTPNFIDIEWDKYCKKIKEQYLFNVIGANRFIKKLNKLTNGFVFNKIFTQKRKNTILNLIECEAHSEILKYILKMEQKND